MPKIHPTAVVDPAAHLADDVEVGPLCYIGPKVTIGAGTRLVSHVAILGRTTIGQGNTIWPQATLGADPQDLKFHGEDTELIIGDHNDIRELVTMHLGTGNGGGVTRVGSDNLIMGGTHIAHDCIVGSHVIMANNVGLAGHVHVEDHANIGGAVGVHHFVTFGQYCFVGGMSRVVQDVPPFMIAEGAPCIVRGVNTIGLKRNRFPEDSIERLKDSYRRLFRRNVSRRLEGEEALELPAAEPQGPSTMAERVAALEADYGNDECVRLLVDFVRRTMIGMYGRYRESERKDKRIPGPTA
jgi:UDP-N-acetylglucosamine acyltransferase